MYPRASSSPFCAASRNVRHSATVTILLSLQTPVELGRGPKSLWSGWRSNDAFDTVAINNFAIDDFAIYNLAIARLGSVAGRFVGHSDEVKVFTMRDDAFALVPGVLVIFHLFVPVGHAPFLLLFRRRQWTCRRQRGRRGRRA